MLSDAHLAPKDPPRILIEISTNSPTLSRSGSRPFIVTLSARVDGPDPIVVGIHDTLLSVRSLALDEYGLTFKNAATGVLAKRACFDVNYHGGGRFFTSMSTDATETPPINHSKEAYKVHHTFQLPGPELRPPQPNPELQFPRSASACSDSSLDDDELERAIRLLCDQRVGLEPGQTYEIGLGDRMSRIQWWRPGSRAEVFAAGRVSTKAQGKALETTLVKTTTFTVVE